MQTRTLLVLVLMQTPSQQPFEDFWSPDHVCDLSLVRGEPSFQQSLDNLRYADLHGVGGVLACTCGKARSVPRDVEEPPQLWNVEAPLLSTLRIGHVSCAGKIVSPLGFKWEMVKDKTPFESEGREEHSSR